MSEVAFLFLARLILVRVEMFNTPNHVLLNVGGQLSWNTGSNAAPASNFGTITGTSSPMRQIQLPLNSTSDRRLTIPPQTG